MRADPSLGEHRSDRLYTHKIHPFYDTFWLRGVRLFRAKKIHPFPLLYSHQIDEKWHTSSPFFWPQLQPIWISLVASLPPSLADFGSQNVNILGLLVATSLLAYIVLSVGAQSHPFIPFTTARFSSLIPLLSSHFTHPKSPLKHLPSPHKNPFHFPK